MCGQKSLKQKGFNRKTWHNIFWQNELKNTSNTVERQTSQPTDQFYQSPNSDVLLLWQYQSLPLAKIFLVKVKAVETFCCYLLCIVHAKNFIISFFNIARNCKMY